jgi:hypothetical protein
MEQEEAKNEELKTNFKFFYYFLSFLSCLSLSFPISFHPLFGHIRLWTMACVGKIRKGEGGPLALKAQQDQIKNIGFDIFLSLSLSLCFFKPKTN